MKRPKKKFKSTSGINFDACCPIRNDVLIPRDLLQINANELEIQRRVNCFIERKRDEINLNNIQNYRNDVTDDPDGQGMTCSRVSSSAFSTRGMSSHLKGSLN